MYLQDGEGLEVGSEEDGGMYSEELDIEQYEYADEQGEEGADGDLDPQEGDLQLDVPQTDMQDEDEQELAEAAEGNDDIEEEAEAPADYPVLYQHVLPFCCSQRRMSEWCNGLTDKPCVLAAFLLSVMPPSVKLVHAAKHVARPIQSCR